ncbi:MAG: sodium:calcium antiporter [Planctomycetes bacterium]|nr:sodium:calcium antiporter [Planctomycetota bacterium]
MTNDIWIFLGAGVLLVVAGSLLARAADAIAEHTRLGRVWVGTVLLAAATSLPELMTDIAAVRIGAIDLAAGDLFGSCMANMLILALVDLALPKRQVLQHASGGHALTSSLAVGLVAIATMALLLRDATTFAGVSIGSWVLAIVFLGGSFAVYRDNQTPSAAPPSAEQVWSLRTGCWVFAVAAVTIFFVAPPFARSAEGIAHATGLGSTFVGTLLVGLATSLPELVASFTAVRLGAYDLAVGNLFGSNAFNMAVFIALDVVHGDASIFAALSSDHAIGGLASMLLMAVGLSAISYRARRRFALVEPSSALMAVIYVATVAILYARATGSQAG